MRYCGYFAAKAMGAAAILYGLLAVLNFAWPPEPEFYGYHPPRFGYNLWYTLLSGLWFILCSAAAYAIVWDQRYRCRVCLRRLRMPVETGSWSRMLQLGRPRIEYICIYGHGTLKEEELQICGRENPQWKPNADMWEELCATGREPEGKS